MDSSRVTARFGRGKNYIAVINGLHPKFKFNREFLKTAPTGDKMNSYETHATIASVEHGTVVEVCTSNYKGKTETIRGIWSSEGLVRMTEMEVIDTFAI